MWEGRATVVVRSLQTSERIKQAAFKLLEWPSQSPDLNPTEDLRTLLKSRVLARQPSNLHELCQEEWSNIQPEFRRKLVDGYRKRLVEVQFAKGHLTKH